MNTAVVDLPDCAYRAVTEEAGTFFCRHSQVHTADHLVDAALCRLCAHRDTECFLPRVVPANPLARTPQSPTARHFNYISTERMIRDVREFAGRLPGDLSGVAGIPRSGMLPATYLAAILHLPLFELCREKGLRPIGNGLRLERLEPRSGPLLVIDDSVYGGRAMALARNSLKRNAPACRAVFAAVYPLPRAIGCLDLYYQIAPEPHLFEWNLFNCNLTQHFAFDFDGVLCHDWPGLDDDGPDYQEFLRTAPPKWLPRRSAVPLIVTARLDKYRRLTEDWLRRHGVRVRELVMGPWTSAQQRRACYDPGEFKGRAYADSNCGLFIESNESQARAIFEVAQKPVLCPVAERVFQ